MANWLVVIDQDRARRAEYAAGLKHVVAPIDGLSVSSSDGDSWSAVWAAADSAPVDIDVGSGGGAFVWGEARDSKGQLRSAASVRKAWRDGAVAQWDGYYSAAVVDEANRTLVAGTDVLGLYPVYYWTDGKGVILVGSSAALFHKHPAFAAELSVEGLVGILLTNGVVAGRTLWSGVRRLAPGNRLRVEDKRVWEDEGYRIPTDATAVDLPFDGHVEQLDAVTESAMKRHVPTGGKFSLLLSGGLDSRLLAGYMVEQNVQVDCLTFGKSREYEMRCAKAVTRELGLRHDRRQISTENYPVAAQASAHWEMLAAGFSGVSEWTTHDAIRALSDRVVVGHVFDGVIGGIHIGWAYDADKGKLGFDGLLPTILEWGIAPDKLKSILSPEVREAVDNVMLSLRDEYDGAAEREHYRSWFFDLHHRQRLHVGSALWPTSFAAWPVSPSLDREVIAVSSAFPSSSLADRRAQTELLVKRFPHLAGLPIDRNSAEMLPPRPRLKDFLYRSMNYRLDALKGRLRSATGGTGPEHIYYRSLYDMNSPEWMTVRRLAEPFRRSLPEVLLPEKVDQLLPDPEIPMHAKNPVTGTSSARLLIGLALFSRSFGTF